MADGDVDGHYSEENMEDGEIPDSEGSEAFIPLASSDIKMESGEYYEEDDEAPEEILNRYAQQRAMKLEEEEPLDPNLCRVCRSKPHKYRCPKCEVRSCSLDCIKRHKDEQNCDGIRPAFQPVSKMSDFDAKTSVSDQTWMAGIQHKVTAAPPSAQNVGTAYRSHQYERGDREMKRELAGDDSHQEPLPGPMEDDGAAAAGPRQFPHYINEDGTRNSANSAVERFLLPNAFRRRVFLSFSDDKGGEDNSRHEQFSDSIFWCIDLTFRKQQDDGTFDDYTYRIQNIPETIRICTILKQFLKPRRYGCIVSESDLDMDKLRPFINEPPENLILLMRVPRFEKERYYIVHTEKSMLDNTRNRVVVDHPKIIVILGRECLNLMTISEDEAEDLRSRLQKERSAQMHREGGGGFRGGRGRGGPHGGGFRGGRGGARGGRGGGGAARRPFDQQGNGPQEGWKRGRGRGGPRGGGFRGGHRDLDTFDPFEPFKGKTTLPSDYGMKKPKDELSSLNWDSLSRQAAQPARPSSSTDYVACDPGAYCP